MSNISITNPGGGTTPVDSIEFIQGNDGINVPSNPSTHILFLLGNNTQGVNLTGNAGTYTETISMFDATTAQKGVTLLASNAETIAGTVTTKAVTPDDLKAKLGAQTQYALPYGNATTGAIQWLAAATNGQIPIGSTGAAPVLGAITSTDGTINVALGAGTIDLSAGNSLWTDKAVGFTAVSGNGYFINATITALLPAAPVQGNKVSFIVSSLDILTIQSQSGQFIQIGSDRSGVNGTAVSSVIGDSIELIYHASENGWYAFTAPTGTWSVST